MKKFGNDYFPFFSVLEEKIKEGKLTEENFIAEGRI